MFLKRFKLKWLIIISACLIIDSSFSEGHAVEITKHPLGPEEELLLLEERIVITATKTYKKLRETPAIITVITAEEIRNMGARNLADVLQIVPGLGVSIGHFGIYQVEARGVKTLNSEKVLILQDGHTLNLPFGGGATRFFGDLVVNNIKQIEIIRGPGSALFGANAFVAVINIITKKGEAIDGVEVKAGGGSFESGFANVLFGHKEDKFQFSGYADYIETDGPRLTVEQDILSNNGQTLFWGEKKDLNLKFSYASISLWGKYMEKKMGPYIGVGYALNDESDLVHKDLRGELSFQHSFKNNLDVMARLYTDYAKLKYFWEIYPEGTVLPTGTFPDGTIGHPTAKNKTMGQELKLDYTIFDVNVITVGAVHEKITGYDVRHKANFNPNNNTPLAGGFQDITDWGNYNENEKKRKVWAFYLQNDLDLMARYGISLVLGARYDHYSEFGGSLNPRTGLTWRLTRDTDLKLLYGKAFRAPSFEELYNKNNPAVLGDTSLGPEKLWTAEAGIIHRTSPTLSFSLNYFYTRIDDLIKLKSVGTGRSMYSNASNRKISGVEAEARTDFGKGHYGFINYTYQRATEEGVHVQDIPTHRANSGVNFKLCEHLNSNTTALFTGRRKREYDDSRESLSEHCLVNQTFILSKFYKTFEIRASAYNLFDKKYADPAPKATVLNDFPRPGRSYVLEASYKF